VTILVWSKVLSNLARLVALCNLRLAERWPITQRKSGTYSPQVFLIACPAYWSICSLFSLSGCRFSLFLFSVTPSWHSCDMATCRDFAKGHCPRGTFCRFPHNIPGKELKDKAPGGRVDVPNFHPKVNNQPRSESLRPTLRPDAPDFQAHRVLPANIPLWRAQVADFQPQTSVPSQAQSIPTRKRAICKFYLENRCTKSDCSFSHNDLAITTPGPAIPRQQPIPGNGTILYDRPECKFFAAGKCGKSSTCLYKHSVKPEPVEMIVQGISDMNLSVELEVQ